MLATAGRLALAILILTITVPISASTLWNWSYLAPGIDASGTFTTEDNPDANGGYLITAIAGIRNGEIITGLQPTGTAIPGNDPFAVDNLVFLGPGPQLTHNGFGFSTSAGNYSNPFYADFLPVPVYLEFFSIPPFTGTPGVDAFEVAVEFSATPAPIPEPASYILTSGGFACLCLVRARRRILE